MKKSALLLSVLLLGIVFSGCISPKPKPLPGKDLTDKGKVIQETKEELSIEKTEKEIDSVFEEELKNLNEEDLSDLENEIT
jgi:PBP1b-binding outer membrane lipoprotein LpoB